MTKQTSNAHPTTAILWLAAFGMWIFPVSLFAQAEPEKEKDKRFGLSFYWENDGSAPKKNNNHDRHYTNGLAVSFTHAPDWANDVADILPFATEFGQSFNSVGYTFGQSFFTPQDLTATALITGDRPYAGYFYLGGFIQRSNENTLDHFQVDLGLTGPSALGEDAQDWAHKFSGTPKANGWDNQLPDEATIQTYIRKKWRVPLKQDGAVAWQLIPQIGAAVGTVYRHIEGYAALRVGVNLPDDFGPSRLADLAGLPRTPQQKDWSLYGYARAGGRAVEHNLFIDGSDFHTSHGVDHEPLVGEVQVGAVVQARIKQCMVGLGYSQTFMTDQFKNQDGSDSYGAIVFSINSEF